MHVVISVEREIPLSPIQINALDSRSRTLIYEAEKVAALQKPNVRLNPFSDPYFFQKNVGITFLGKRHAQDLKSISGALLKKENVIIDPQRDEAGIIWGFTYVIGEKLPMHRDLDDWDDLVAQLKPRVLRGMKIPKDHPYHLVNEGFNLGLRLIFCADQ